MSSPAQLAALAGAFTAGTVVSELAGAANLGVAISFGMLAFMVVLVFLVLRVD